MRHTRTSLCWVATLCASAMIVAAQVVPPPAPPPPGTEMEEPEKPAVVAPSTMKAALWTDRLDYSPGEPMSLYASLDPMGDPTPPTV